MEEEIRQHEAIGPDQAKWLLDALERFAVVVRRREPSVSRKDGAAKMACALEIIDVLLLELDDEGKNNIIAGALPELIRNNDVPTRS